MAVIHLTSLSLTHFRNYAHARLEVDARPVVLTGANGAGKTNILEAVSLLVPGRGLRRAKLGELEQHAADAPWAVAATVQGMQGEVRIGTGRDAEAMDAEKRLLRIDGKPAKSQAELARHAALLWLTPQMEQLFQEGASSGRKFVDRLVFSFEAEHASRVNDYDYAMRERNRLLTAGRADPFWLDSLEQKMAETGAAIAQARLTTAEHLNHAIAASSLSFPKARIAIEGTLEAKLAAQSPALEVEEAFRAALAESRGQDATAGRTLAGPHRSALRVTHLDKQMPAEQCSTGEQKAVLLSILLAQARAGQLWHGVVPMLLLDEVTTHLDAQKRAELFEEILDLGAQVWMTGTDEEAFAGLAADAQGFVVVQNSILPTH